MPARKPTEGRTTRTRRIPLPAGPSGLESLLLLHMAVAGLPVPEQQFAFARSLGRRWRADFAWPQYMLLVETEGGVTPYRDPRTGELRQGRHNTILGSEADMEKYNTAALMGYTVLRFSRRMVDDCRAIEAIKQAIKMAQERVTIEATVVREGVA